MADGLAFEQGVRVILRDAGLGEARDIRPLDGGLSHTTYAVDRRWVVRIGTGPDGKQLPKSAGVLRAVAGRVAAPALVGVDFSRTHVPYNVLVCSFVEGRRMAELWPAAPAPERRRLVFAVARELDALHALPPESVECFRDLAPWAERKEKRVRAALDCARETGEFEVERLDRMQAYLEAHVSALGTAGPAVLAHCDVHWENVIVRDAASVALLDFDDVEVAPAELDVWELLFAVGAADAPEAPLHGVDDVYGAAMRAPGVLERFAIGEIEEILELATRELGWISREAARVEADAAYRRTFESDLYPRLLARVAGRLP